MTDTPAEIEQLMRDKLMALSSEERFAMGAQMFESAREMVKASLPRSLSEGGTATVIVHTNLPQGN